MENANAISKVEAASILDEAADRLFLGASNPGGVVMPVVQARFRCRRTEAVGPLGAVLRFAAEALNLDTEDIPVLSGKYGPDGNPAKPEVRALAYRKAAAILRVEAEDRV